MFRPDIKKLKSATVNSVNSLKNFDKDLTERRLVNALWW